MRWLTSDRMLSVLFGSCITCLVPISLLKADITPGDMVVTERNTPLKIRSTTLATLSKGTELVAGEVNDDWISVSIDQRGKTVTGWLYSPHAAKSTKYEFRSVETSGYVVGRVYLRLAGFQDINKDFIESVKVKVAYVKNHEQTLLTAATDSKGYFLLKDQPLDGTYWVHSIKTDRLDQSIPSVVPDPSPSEGISGLLYLSFGSGRRTNGPIIDVGETILLLRAKGKLAVRRRCGTSQVTLDTTQDKPLQFESIDCTYPGLRYFASSRVMALRPIATEAYHLHHRLANAIPIKREADKLRGTDLKAATAKYRIAIQTYPAYDQAYLALANALDDGDGKQLAIDYLRAARPRCPMSNSIVFGLGRAYLNANQRTNAISLLSEFVEQHPADLEGYENLADAYAAVDRTADADALWEKAIRNVQSETRFRSAARFYGRAGEMAKAISLYERYLQARPDSTAAKAYLTVAHVTAGKSSEALKLASRFDKASIYYHTYREFRKKDQYDKAEQMLRRAIASIEDGSLSKKKEELEKQLVDLPFERQCSDYFRMYLKAIQRDGDHANWNGKPYDRFVARHPIPTE